MGTTDYDDAAAGCGLSGILTAPLTQATVTGLLTLIPARNYPQWLRRAIIWAPGVMVSAGMATMAAYPQSAQQSSQATESAPPGGLRSVALTTVASVPIGVVLSASMAAAFWADEALERGLRRMRVPFPRAVLGAAAGAATWWSATRADQQHARQDTSRVTG